MKSNDGDTVHREAFGCLVCMGLQVPSQHFRWEGGKDMREGGAESKEEVGEEWRGEEKIKKKQHVSPIDKGLSKSASASRELTVKRHR